MGIWREVGQSIFPKYPYLAQIGDAQHEADGVQYVRLARSIESCDGVELRIESLDIRSLSVRLKSVQSDLFDMHSDDSSTIHLSYEGWCTIWQGNNGRLDE